jgi:glutathione S-transferase
LSGHVPFAQAAAADYLALNPFRRIPTPSAAISARRVEPILRYLAHRGERYDPTRSTCARARVDW